jgi:hypothetical protein
MASMRSMTARISSGWQLPAPTLASSWSSYARVTVTTPLLSRSIQRVQLGFDALQVLCFHHAPHLRQHPHEAAAFIVGQLPGLHPAIDARCLGQQPRQHGEQVALPLDDAGVAFVFSASLLNGLSRSHAP